MDYCENKDQKECLDALIKEINSNVRIGGLAPSSIPNFEMSNIIERAKNYFYKIYEDSLEEIYLALNTKSINTKEFKYGYNSGKDEKIKKESLKNTRGVVTMPSEVYSVNGVYEMHGFSGEDGSFSSSSFTNQNSDFAVDKFIFQSSYGTGFRADDLMYYVINQKYVDNARQILQNRISGSYNRLTHKFRFTGELPKSTCIFDVYIKIPDCSLFQDDYFIRYCIAKVKVETGRALASYSYNLPGGITPNPDVLMEAKEELNEIVEEIKGENGADFFLTS